jgi:predicted nuclease of predicted toxin-antitoxin system
MAYAKAQGFVILTHDLDFGTLLALTAADGPSVIQVRSQDLLSDAFREILVAALGQFEADLQVGAIVVIDGSRARARVLPLSRGA